jgi:hypothetical protein
MADQTLKAVRIQVHAFRLVNGNEEEQNNGD